MKFSPGDRARFENKEYVIDPRNGEECVVQSPGTTGVRTTIPIKFYDGTMGLAFEEELTPVLKTEAWIQVTFEKGHVLNSQVTTAAELVEECDGSVLKAREGWEATIQMTKDIGSLETFYLTLRDGTTVGINPSRVSYASVIGGKKVLAELEGMGE